MTLSIVQGDFFYALFIFTDFPSSFLPYRRIDGETSSFKHYAWLILVDQRA